MTRAEADAVKHEHWWFVQDGDYLDYGYDFGGGSKTGVILTITLRGPEEERGFGPYVVATRPHTGEFIKEGGIDALEALRNGPDWLREQLGLPLPDPKEYQHA